MSQTFPKSLIYIINVMFYVIVTQITKKTFGQIR